MGVNIMHALNTIRDRTFTRAHVNFGGFITFIFFEQKISVSQEIMKRAYDKKYNATSYERESYRVGDTVQHLNLVKDGKGSQIGRKFEPNWLPVHGYFVVEKVGEYGDVLYIIDPKKPQSVPLRRSIEHIRRFPGTPKHVSRAKGGPKSKRGVKRKLE